MNSMRVYISGDRAVSYDFFEDDREALEDEFNVGIDSGPGGVVEIVGAEDDVVNFLDSHGLRLDDVEVVQEQTIKVKLGTLKRIIKEAVHGESFDLAYNPNDPGFAGDIMPTDDPDWVRITGSMEEVLSSIQSEHRKLIEQHLPEMNGDLEDVLANFYEGFPFVLMNWSEYEEGGWED